jgi:hypothetical protein
MPHEGKRCSTSRHPDRFKSSGLKEKEGKLEMIAMSESQG